MSTTEKYLKYPLYSPNLRYSLILSIYSIDKIRYCLYSPMDKIDISIISIDNKILSI